ncbi:zinc finger BED domain-containing protein RICESLEEPER 2, partial [Tanacetum coccineum]
MASESASTTTGAGSTSALTIREIIPTNRTPEVWKDFNMCIMTNGQKKVQCKYCFHFFSEGSMDILSVQASSVASESAFSTSGRLLTIRRTRLTPESLEMCMCLKDHLDAQERKQDT